MASLFDVDLHLSVLLLVARSVLRSHRVDGQVAQTVSSRVAHARGVGQNHLHLGEWTSSGLGHP